MRFLIWVTQRIFVRYVCQEEKNKSGVISIPVLEKRDGKSVLVKTIGSSIISEEVNKLFQEGREFVRQYAGQQVLQFENEQEAIDRYFNSLQSFSLIGAELLLGHNWV